MPDRVWLALLSLLAFGWRVAGLTSQSLWRDEVDALQFASRSWPDLLATFAKPGENGPLFFALLHPWLQVAGTSDYALRMQAAAGGVLTVVLTWVLARRLLRLAAADTPAAPATATIPLLAALLVAVNPYLTWYSQEAKMYGWLPALVLLTLLAFLAALQQGQWHRWLLYLLLLGVTVLHHVWAVLLIPLCLSWLLWLWPDTRRRLLPFVLTLALPLLPYFTLVGWWQWRLFTTTDFQTGHPFVPLPQIATNLTTAMAIGVRGGPSLLPIALLIFLWLIASLLGRQALPAPNKAGRVLGMLWTWLFLPPLLIFLVSLRKPLFTDRYLIWIAPAALLLAAWGIVTLARLWRPLGAATVLLVVAFSLLQGWQQMHTPIKADFRAAAVFVEAQRGPEDVLLFQIPYNRAVYTYYAGTNMHIVDGRYTNSGISPTQVDQEMVTLLANASTVWFIASEEAMWDNRGLTRAWLDAHGHATARRAFARVEVVRYTLTR